MVKRDFKNAITHSIEQYVDPKGKENDAPAKETEVPAGYKLNPQYIEKKDRRVQLLMQPSLYDKIKQQAQSEGRSVNDLIHSILEDAMEGDSQHE